MGMAVDAYSSDSALQTRREREHRLAMALLTKSRCFLSSRARASTTSTEIETLSPPQIGSRDDITITHEQLESDAHKRRRPPLAPPTQPNVGVAALAVARKKRQAAALSTFAALQTGGVKRSRLASLLDRRTATSNGDNSSSSRSMARREWGGLRGIARRSVSGRPRSLQFALQGLSSADTRYLLQLLGDLPHDIAELNASSGSICNSPNSPSPPTLRVFGWRNRFLQPCGVTNLVVWKAAKTFEATAMRPLARKVWDSIQTLSRMPAASQIQAFDVLYEVSASVRVVRSVDSLYGRSARETLWLECLLDRDDHICIGRRQLTHFRDYRLLSTFVAAAATDSASDSHMLLDDAECECEGVLFRPYLTRISDTGDSTGGSTSDSGTFMLGCTLQRVRSLAGRDLTPQTLVQNVVDDLPRATLQWEETVVHDLLPQITF